MRHTCEGTYKGLPVTVAAGYDVPLQGWFMTVEPVGDHPDADEETGMIYSNLDDEKLAARHGFADDLNYFKNLVKTMGIEIESEFFAKVFAICD